MKKLIALIFISTILSGCANYHSFFYELTHPESSEEWIERTGGMGGGGTEWDF